VISNKMVSVNGGRFTMDMMILIGQLIVVKLPLNKLDLVWILPPNLS
jgi:hypothetical protein